VKIAIMDLIGRSAFLHSVTKIGILQVVSVKESTKTEELLPSKFPSKKLGQCPEGCRFFSSCLFQYLLQQLCWQE